LASIRLATRAAVRSTACARSGSFFAGVGLAGVIFAGVTFAGNGSGTASRAAGSGSTGTGTAAGMETLMPPTTPPAGAAVAA
jgi:hypothetical protein